MGCVPTAREAVVKVAAPLSPNCAVARLVGPSLKVTDPTGGTPASVPIAVAVNVTVCPLSDGLGEAVSPRLVPINVTDSERVALLELKLVDPAYCAVIACAPKLNNEVVNVATPLGLRATAARAVAPSEKVTEPVGVMVPCLARTVAVKTIGCVTAEGFGEAVSEVTEVAPMTTICTAEELLG